MGAAAATGATTTPAPAATPAPPVTGAATHSYRVTVPRPGSRAGRAGHVLPFAAAVRAVTEEPVPALPAAPGRDGGAGRNHGAGSRGTPARAWASSVPAA
ncbi:hypothetical protein OG788_45220 [Streptomyces sp. NBC_00647]|uniref:hypothetical protein n=1 Tax=Streptomyces sp. NBC_00647 TaxID=2975796 RepID=UPI003255245D